MAAEILSKEPCKLCLQENLDTTGDNCVTFVSGVQHCHRHGVIGVPKKKQENIKNMGSKLPLEEGILCALTSRKISKETCEFYGYLVNPEKKIHIANYYNGSGQVVCQMLRHHPKRFEVRGNSSYMNQLWGMNKFTPNENKYITITEGQIDTLAIAETFNCRYPVVSLPNGAGSAENVIRHNLSWLLGFKYVVLAFDNDGPGRQAIEDCIELFPPGKVRVAQWRTKDAGDLCKEELYQEIRETIQNAVAYIPPAILTGDNLLAKLDGFVSETVDWPWETLRRNLNPMQKPSVITWAGLPGVGKTVLMNGLIKHSIGNGMKVGIISLEQMISRAVLTIASDLTGIPLNKINDRSLTEEELQQCKWVTDSLVVFDHETYGSDIYQILDALPHIARSLDCETIIFDNLSYSATNASDDERRHIDKAMIALKDCSTKHNFILHNIAHLNGDEESMRGSRGIFMYSDSVIYLSRDVEAEDIMLRNTLNFHVKKDRATGEDVGKFLQMYYNIETRCLEDFRHNLG